MADLPVQKQKDNIIIAAIKVARPIHWTKNLSVFAAIFLSGMLFDKGQLALAFQAFIVFCIASSATYIVNDLLDVKRDRLHPVKKFRPIASGALPIPVAIFEAVFLGGIALLASASINSALFLLVLGYLILQLSYSL